MTPQERHYARLGMEERADHAKARDLEAAHSRHLLRMVIMVSAAILVGSIAGDLATGWIEDQAAAAVSRE